MTDAAPAPATSTPAAAPASEAPAPNVQATAQPNIKSDYATGEGSPDKSSHKTDATAPKDKEATGKGAPEPEARYEIKVNGKTKNVTKEELIRLAQLSEAATQRFESASQKEKRAQSIIDQAKQNPMAALMDPALGLSKEQIREHMEDWYNREFIEPETLTVEQRRLKELERENAVYRKLQEDERAAQQQAIEAKQDAEYQEHFQQQIIDAIETYKLPKTKSNVKKIAFYMRQSLQNGWDAPMELILQKVKEDRAAEDSEINEYDYDSIVERFGEDFIKKLITENLKRLKERRAKEGPASYTKKPLKPSEKTGEKITMREANLKLKAMRSGK